MKNILKYNIISKFYLLISFIICNNISNSQNLNDSININKANYITKDFITCIDNKCSHIIFSFNERVLLMEILDNQLIIVILEEKFDFELQKNNYKILSKDTLPVNNIINNIFDYLPSTEPFIYSTNERFNDTFRETNYIYFRYASQKKIYCELNIPTLYNTKAKNRKELLNQDLFNYLYQILEKKY